ncbi:hypothetical protein ACFQFH_20095 [Halobaculum halobium]|uniref:PGF-CTERM protein n=1 Tax=Halobaculum halobium TaxID=3032281 RepID=A0ABD5TH44_9EURY|nr:hypothetical protein [Halobaculum sp. SYNS20]
MVGGLTGPSWDQDGGGGGTTDTTDDTDSGGSDDSGGSSDYTNDTEDIEQDQTSDDLDLGQADGGGLEYDSEDSAGNVVDSDGDPDTGGVTIISDNNSDDPAADDAQQDLTDDALDTIGGSDGSDGSGGSDGSDDTGGIESGVVDSESGEYTDGADTDNQPDNTPADTETPGVGGDIGNPALLALALVVVGWVMYGGE